MNTKQIIVIRKDLKMRRGKEIAQGAHASLAFLTRSLELHPCVLANGKTLPRWEASSILRPEVVDWLRSSYRKITCQVDSEAELLALDESAKAAKIESHLIQDRGLTEFDGVPTYTALALGPDYDEKLDAITSHLKLY